MDVVYGHLTHAETGALELIFGRHSQLLMCMYACLCMHVSVEPHQVYAHRAGLIVWAFCEAIAICLRHGQQKTSAWLDTCCTAGCWRACSHWTPYHAARLFEGDAFALHLSTSASCSMQLSALLLKSTRLTVLQPCSPGIAMLNGCIAGMHDQVCIQWQQHHSPTAYALMWALFGQYSRWLSL